MTGISEKIIRGYTRYLTEFVSKRYNLNPKAVLANLPSRKNLKIENDIATQQVSPGTRFVLSFDFSGVIRGGDIIDTHESFLSSVNTSIQEFFERYAG